MTATNIANTIVDIHVRNTPIAKDISYLNIEFQH